MRAVPEVCGVLEPQINSALWKLLKLVTTQAAADSEGEPEEAIEIFFFSSAVSLSQWTQT